MIKVIIRGDWSDCVGTDYCHALGIYETLEDAAGDAEDYAWGVWEPQGYDEDDGFEEEGPEYWVEEYNPKKHDMLRVGGGSFKQDFESMK